MWPKLLFELLPHFSRLIPAADKYLSTRSASEKAQEAALAALAADVRGEVGKVTEAQDGLRRQLQEQDAQIADMAVDVTRARMGVESAELRIAKLEKTLGMVVMLLWVGLGLVAATLGVVLVRVLR